MHRLEKEEDKGGGVEPDKGKGYGDKGGRTFNGERWLAADVAAGDGWQGEAVHCVMVSGFVCRHPLNTGGRPVCLSLFVVHCWLLLFVCGRLLIVCGLRGMDFFDE